MDSRGPTIQSAAEAAAQAARRNVAPRLRSRPAEAVGAAMLVDGSSCSTPQVQVDTSTFAPGGQVTVTVSCTVSSNGLELIDPPATGPTTATAFAFIDPLRATEETP